MSTENVSFEEFRYNGTLYLFLLVSTCVYLFLRSTQHQETTFCLPCFAFSHYTFLLSRCHLLFILIILLILFILLVLPNFLVLIVFITFDFDVLSLSTFNPSPSLLIVDHSTIVRANPYLLSLLSINVVPEKEERQEGEEEGKTAPEHVPMKRRSQTAP